MKKPLIALIALATLGNISSFAMPFETSEQGSIVKSGFAAVTLNSGLYKSNSTRCDLVVASGDSDTFYLQVSGPADAHCSFQGVLLKVARVKGNLYRAYLSKGYFDLTVINSDSFTDGRYLYVRAE